MAAGLAAGMAVIGVTEAVPAAGRPGHQDLSGAHVVVGTLAEVDDAVLAEARGPRRWSVMGHPRRWVPVDRPGVVGQWMAATAHGRA